MNTHWMQPAKSYTYIATASWLLALAFASTAISQAVVQQVPPATQAAPVLPVGQVDLAKSRAYAKVGKTGLGHDHAIEGRIMQGSILLGAKQKAGSIVFDMTSYRADTAVARRYIGLEGTIPASTQRQTNANMLGASVLDVRRYPTSTFVIDSALPTARKSRDGHPLFKLAGHFTLHGTTRPLEINAEVRREQGRDRLRSGFKINQSDFGITPFSKAFGAVGVADQMTIFGEIYVAAASPVAHAQPQESQR